MNADVVAGVGQSLAAVRLEKGLTVETVAEKLKLTVRQVEALEAEDFAQLPGALFVRGFVRNYARFLGIDPQPLLAALDLEQRPTETLTAPSEGVRFDASPVRKWLLIPLLVFLLFLILVAGLYAWLSQGEEAMVTPEPTLPQSSESPVTVAAAPATEVAPVPAGDVAPPAPPAPVPDATNATGALPVAQEPAPQVTAPVAPVPTGAVLRFRVEDDAWIQVVDAAGQRYSRLVRAGSTETLQGKPPFKLVVGNAALVKLEYNDHLIDLTPFIGEKVARLTLE